MKYKRKIIKWTVEFFLIVFSVLLAFIIEEHRQNSSERRELVGKLLELKSSLKRDSTMFQNKAERLLVGVDNDIKIVLQKIEKREAALSVIFAIDNASYYYPIRNWTLDKILQDESISKLSSDFRTALFEYRYDRDWTNEVYEKKLFQNDDRIRNLLSENIKYEIRTDNIRDIKSKEFLRNSNISDSSILYSDKLTGYLIQNMELLRVIREGTNLVPSAAHKTIELIDKEIEQLQ